MNVRFKPVQLGCVTASDGSGNVTGTLVTWDRVGESWSLWSGFGSWRMLGLEPELGLGLNLSLGLRGLTWEEDGECRICDVRAPGRVDVGMKS